MTPPGLRDTLPLSIGGGRGGCSGARELECVRATAGGSVAPPLAGASSCRYVTELLRALRRFRGVSQPRGGGRGGGVESGCRLSRALSRFSGTRARTRVFCLVIHHGRFFSLFFFCFLLLCFVWFGFLGVGRNLILRDCLV